MTSRVSALAEIVRRAVDHGLDDPSLTQGLVGAVWFLAATGDLGDRSCARRALSRAAAALGSAPPTVAFFSGLTGLQWTLDALSPTLYESAPDADADVDRLLTGILRHPSWRGELDLAGGLIGIGVYALASPRARLRAQLCAAIVDHLERAAVHPAPEHATWVNAPEHLSPTARADFPRGRIDLGIAHGVPGMIAWLAEVVAHRETEPTLQRRAEHLLDGAASWLCSRPEPGEHGHGFPYFVQPDGRPVTTPRVRLAWCYGDLGIATVLMRAAAVRGRKDWAATATAAGRRAAARALEDSGVTDPWLCHGGAGIAHLFALLHGFTGEAVHAAAAQRWWSWTLDAVDGESPALLTGAAGLGLALLSAQGAEVPRWDAFMLL